MKDLTVSASVQESTITSLIWSWRLYATWNATADGNPSRTSLFFFPYIMQYKWHFNYVKRKTACDENSDMHLSTFIVFAYKT